MATCRHYRARDCLREPRMCRRSLLEPAGDVDVQFVEPVARTGRLRGPHHAHRAPRRLPSVRCHASPRRCSDVFSGLPIRMVGHSRPQRTKSGQTRGRTSPAENRREASAARGLTTVLLTTSMPEARRWRESWKTNTSPHRSRMRGQWCGRRAVGAARSRARVQRVGHPDPLGHQSSP
jgi:hypothetical protein